MILEVLSRQKWEKRKLKITWCVYILGFQLFSQKYKRRWLNICALFLVYSQIWLNIPRDGFHFLLHLPMDDRHIGYEQIFLFFLKHWPGATVGEELLSQNFVLCKNVTRVDVAHSWWIMITTFAYLTIPNIICAYTVIPYHFWQLRH